MQATSPPILNLADMALAQARADGSRVALIDADRRLSFGDLDALSGQSAAALVAAGVSVGDRVAILARNSALFFEALIACAKLGAMLLPLNWRLAAPELAYILADAEPKVVIADDAFRSLLDEAMGLARLRPLVLSTGAGDGKVPAYAAWRGRHDAIRPAAPDANDAALLLYTSGTTGKPKGALVPHRALVEMRRLEATSGPDWLKWSPDDLCLVSMPLFHIAGIRTAICGLYNGCPVHVLSEFDADKVLDLVGAGRVTKLFLVPAAMRTLARHPRRPEVDFSRVRYMIYGGSPIALPLLQECMAAFGCGFVQAYGSTESAGGVLTLSPADHGPAAGERMASAGLPVPGVEVRILRDDGQPAPRGEIGEVAIKGASTMLGYWRLPVASAAALDGDGWLRMGDLGMLDADGYLHLRGRAREMIITGGENVYPIEVENALASHAAVADVAVVGLPSERWGEEVCAVVVLHTGKQAGEAELVRWARERIAAYKTPKMIAFAEVLPRNAAGKVLKQKLQADLTGASAAGAANARPGHDMEAAT